MQPSTVFDTDYYKRLGLEFDPFAPGALPDFFFVGAQRRFLVQRAIHALYFSGAIVLLLGSEGTGKTRTLTEIEKELKELVDICRIDATVLMDAAEIRAQVVTKLGLPCASANGNAEFVYALERMWPGEGDPQPVLIAIDAAQLLSIETLAESVALIAGAGGRLRLLLAGEPVLATAWQQAQAGAAEMLELKSLDRNETEDYACTKLQAAGYREERPLGEEGFDRLFAESGGNFTMIDAFMPQLLQPSPATMPIVGRIKTLPILHIGVVAALLTVVILLALYRGGDGPATSEADLTSTENRSTNESGSDKNTIALQLPTAAAPASQSNAAPSPDSKIEIPLPAAETKTTPPKAEVEEPLKTLPAQKLDNDKIASAKPIADDRATAAANADSDERALLAFPKSQYVLQLIGTESQATIDKFAKGAGKGLQLYTYRTQLRGKPWFIAVTGPYSDKNAAQAAIAKLPEAVRKQQPWPRTLANVQSDIRAHSGR